MYKAITFFDLDHTLLNDQTQVDPEVADAMQQLRANNILPVISTGRNIFEITHVLDATKIDTIVSANGDYVVYKNQPVYKAILDTDLILDFMDFAKSLGDSTTVMDNKGFHLNFMTSSTKSNYDSINTPIPPLGAAEFARNNDIYMLVVNTVGHDQKFFDKFAGKLTFYRNTPFSMDVVVNGGSKKRGIVELVNNANLAGIPTYAFGDGNNDIPMLDYVDHPVVMGNGLPNVMPYAEFVTTTNTDHGIVNGLKHYELI